jgi:hypothetical protein
VETFFLGVASRLARRRRQQQRWPASAALLADGRERPKRRNKVEEVEEFHYTAKNFIFIHNKSARLKRQITTINVALICARVLLFVGSYVRWLARSLLLVATCSRAAGCQAKPAGARLLMAMMIPLDDDYDERRPDE